MNSVNNDYMSDSKSEKKIPDSVNATPGISVDSVIRYWRNSLSDEKMIGISRKEMRKGSGVKFEELKSGKLPSSLLTNFFNITKQR